MNNATIIDLLDSNVDGNGTDIHVLIEVSGEKPVSQRNLHDIEHIIALEKGTEDYQTDDINEAVMRYLRAEGFEVRELCPEKTIDFADIEPIEP